MTPSVPFLSGFACRHAGPAPATPRAIHRRESDVMRLAGRTPKIHVDVLLDLPGRTNGGGAFCDGRSLLRSSMGTSGSAPMWYRSRGRSCFGADEPSVRSWGIVGEGLHSGLPITPSTPIGTRVGASIASGSPSQASMAAASRGRSVGGSVWCLMGYRRRRRVSIDADPRHLIRPDGWAR